MVPETSLKTCSCPMMLAEPLPENVPQWAEERQGLDEQVQR